MWQVALGVVLIHLPEFAPASMEAPAGTRPSLGRPSARLCFLAAGRFETLKGFHTLIPFFRNHTEFLLLLAGGGRQESVLRKLAGDSAQIGFPGVLPRAQLASLYRGAVAVIVPSRCMETFSLVTVEAFQQRTPVIARNLGGPAKLLAESGGDAARRTEPGNAGYSGYRRYWTQSVHMDRYLSIIGELKASATEGGAP